MKRHSYILLIPLWLSLLVFNSCQSAKKSLKRGDFDDSVLRAAEKLRSTPNHISSIDILKAAYPRALEQHLDDISKNKNSSDPFRWETELNGYTRLNRLFGAVNRCPACMKAVTPQNFATEEQYAREQAAAARYKEGERFLAHGDLQNARLAHGQFETANNLVQGYKDVKEKMDLARDLGTFKVVVEQVLVTSRVYQLSNAYFQEQVNKFLQTNRQINKFVRFYTPGEATDMKLQPDHVVTLQFDDFTVGQTLIEKNTETVTSQDSVKVSEKMMGKIKVPIYGKVTAKLTKSRKTIHSSGLLDMQIQDFKTRRIVSQQKFTGEYNWMCEWASYNGDERALTAAEQRMCKSQELSPPAPQELFIEFSKPIYDRLTSELRAYYASR